MENFSQSFSGLWLVFNVILDRALIVGVQYALSAQEAAIIPGNKYNRHVVGRTLQIQDSCMKFALSSFNGNFVHLIEFKLLVANYTFDLS